MNLINQSVLYNEEAKIISVIISVVGSFSVKTRLFNLTKRMCILIDSGASVPWKGP